MFKLNKRFLGIIICALILLIAGLHNAATVNYWYWIFSPMDMIMHFLAGLWIGLAVYWIYAYWLNMEEGVSIFPLAMAIAIAVLTIGVCWEFFEYYFGIVRILDGYVLDTAKDLIMDTVGGIVAGLIVYTYGPHK